MRENPNPNRPETYKGLWVFIEGDSGNRNFYGHFGLVVDTVGDNQELLIDCKHSICRTKAQVTTSASWTHVKHPTCVKLIPQTVMGD